MPVIRNERPPFVCLLRAILGKSHVLHFTTRESRLHRTQEMGLEPIPILRRSRFLLGAEDRLQKTDSAFQFYNDMDFGFRQHLPIQHDENDESPTRRIREEFTASCLVVSTDVTTRNTRAEK